MRKRTFGIVFVAVALALTACGKSNSKTTTNARMVKVVAAENFWGDITKQIGGSHVIVKSIIKDPSVDPHLYESSATDADAIANADVVIENGAGYDDFVEKLIKAQPSSNRTVLSVEKILNVGSNPNPHFWYDIPRVPEIAQAITNTLADKDPVDATSFKQNLSSFKASLSAVSSVIDQIKAKYAGSPVAYTERVPEYLLKAANLKIKTPAGFASAIEDGSNPSASDTKEMQDLIKNHQIKVLLYNSQAVTSVTQHVRQLATDAGVKVIGVTETIPPGATNYQEWQKSQLNALLTALGG
jgi:zinc/manganese transport system substrate-binding protein